MPVQKHRWKGASVALLLLIAMGCRMGSSEKRPDLPPPTPMQDGSLSYQVGPEHPLAQQADAIRAAAAAQSR